jgi:hypothetical protein
VSIHGKRFESTPLTPEELESQDCVALLTPHPGLDVMMLLRSSQLVFDSRGVTSGLEARNVVRL